MHQYLQIVAYCSDGVSIFAALRRDKLDFCINGASFSSVTPVLQYSNTSSFIQKQNHWEHSPSFCS